MFVCVLQWRGEVWDRGSTDEVGVPGCMCVCACMNTGSKVWMCGYTRKERGRNERKKEKTEPPARGDDKWLHSARWLPTKVLATKDTQTKQIHRMH